MQFFFKTSIFLAIVLIIPTHCYHKTKKQQSKPFITQRAKEILKRLKEEKERLARIAAHQNSYSPNQATQNSAISINYRSSSFDDLSGWHQFKDLFDLDSLYARIR